MKRTHFSSALLTATLVASVMGSACSSAPGSSGDEGVTPAAADSESVESSGRLTWWRLERTARDAKVAAYLVLNYDNWQSFKNAPVGSSGIPMIMMRLFPEILPDIWGAPADNFAQVGFAKDPYEPARVLPLGLGYIAS